MFRGNNREGGNRSPFSCTRIHKYIYIFAYTRGELDDVDSRKQIVAARNDKLTGPAHSYGHWLIAIYLQISRALRAFTPRARRTRPPPRHVVQIRFCGCCRRVHAARCLSFVADWINADRATPKSPLPYFQPRSFFLKRNKKRKKGRERERGRMEEKRVNNAKRTMYISWAEKFFIFEFRWKIIVSMRVYFNIHRVFSSILFRLYPFFSIYIRLY